MNTFITMLHIKPLKEPWPRIIGIPLVGLALSLIFSEEQPVTLLNVMISVLITGIMWQGDYMILTRLRRVWPSLHDTGKRVAITIVLVLVYNTSADMLICETLNEFMKGRTGDGPPEMQGYLLRNLITTMVIGSLYEAGYFFARWREQVVQTEQVKTRQLRAELDALRTQVAPHFLFNSLNTLVALIHENPATAARFTERLSEVYRYILAHRECDVVSLHNEIDFVKAYFYLMKIRFEEGIHLHVNIPENYLHHHVAPLSLQMLVENAVKHNVASPARPLNIAIYVENGKSVVVKNNLQRKINGVNSVGFGLENTRRTYTRLSDEQIDVIETRDHYMVALPLLRVERTGKTFPLAS